MNYFPPELIRTMDPEQLVGTCLTLLGGIGLMSTYMVGTVKNRIQVALWAIFTATSTALFATGIVLLALVLPEGPARVN